MPREWNSTLFDFARVEGHAIAAGFDSGRITSDAGAFLLGAIKRVVGASRRLTPASKRNAGDALHDQGFHRAFSEGRIAAVVGYEELKITTCATPGDGRAGQQTHRQPCKLRNAGWQEHAEPAEAQQRPNPRATTRAPPTPPRSSGCQSVCSSMRRVRRRPTISASRRDPGRVGEMVYFHSRWNASPSILSAAISSSLTLRFASHDQTGLGCRGGNYSTTTSRLVSGAPRQDAAKCFVCCLAVERTIAWLNRHHRLAKDVEATVESFTTWLYILASS